MATLLFTAIGTIVGGPLGGAIGALASSAAMRAPRRHTAEAAMPRFAANLSMLFTERPFLDRFAAAAAAGFVVCYMLLRRKLE